jgi:ATP-dependent DNA ligase
MYELKLDGYRVEAVTTGGRVTLYSRWGTDLCMGQDTTFH